MSDTTEYISVNEMISNWNKILSRIGKISGCTTELLPNPMLIGKTSMEKVRAARELSEIIYKNQVLDSMEERRILYYRIGYCSASDSRFTDFRHLVYRLKTACGYHGKFRGVLVLDITEWRKHSNENYFDVLLCYLADLREDVYTVFCMDTDPGCEDRDVCCKISQYFRLNMVDLTKNDAAEYFRFTREKLWKNKVGIEQEAERVLLKYIEKMRENKSFCGYETVRRMTEEMICHFYLYTSGNRKMTADFVSHFFKRQEWIRMPEKGNSKIKWDFIIQEKEKMDRVHQDRYQEYIEFDQESRFASSEEVKRNAKHIDLQAEFYDDGGMPLLANPKEAYIDTADHHNLILGSTGSGKTRRLILILINILLRSPGSLIIVDVKGMLRRMTSGLAKRMGKKVISLDMKEFRHGECWNPLEEPAKLYYEGHRDQACELFADFMDGLAAAQEQNTRDIFFVGMAKSFGNAILQAMAECLPPSMNNVANFVELCSESNYENMVEFSQLMSYSSKTATAFRGIYSAAEKTRQSIEVSLYEMIRLFSTNEQMTRMLSKSTFDIHEIACGNCVVYIEIADEKPTYHAIASMFIKQVYEILVRDAQGKPEERLLKPTYFVIDEFGNIPRIENMSNIITAARSRNIFCTLVVQSYHQLQRIYGHDAETIKANCQNWFYLFSRELSMLNEISELCGEIRTAEGGVRRLISVSELQRFKMGEMLVMHDRLYPYVTYMPDISEYRLKNYPEMPKKEIEAQYNEIVKIENLIRRIQVGDFPVPFKSEVPAIKQVMERAKGKSSLPI